MAQFWCDFSQYPLNAKLDGGAYDWTVMSGAADYTFEARENALAPSGVGLYVHRGGYAGPTLWRWNGVPNAANVEVFIKWYTATAEADGGRVAPGSPAARLTPAGDGYWGGTNSAGGTANTWQEMRRLSGNTLISQGGLFTMQGNRVRNHLFRTNGSSLALTAWWDDEAKPASPTLSATHAGVSAAGGVGFRRQESGGYAMWILGIGVGTDGDPAPTAPIGPAERQRSRLILTPW